MLSPYESGLACTCAGTARARVGAARGARVSVVCVYEGALVRYLSLSLLGRLG